MLFTITVLDYRHQQRAWSDSKLITEFKKKIAEYYVALAILYREVPHMPHANYQPNRSGGTGEEWFSRLERANSVNLDEVAHYEPSHQDLRCLQI